MKNIFSLIFSVGLMTAAFAQGGHRHRDYNSSGASQNQSYNYQDYHRYGQDQTYQADQRGWDNDRRDEKRHVNWSSYGDRHRFNEDYDGDRVGRERFNHHERARHWKRQRARLFFGFRSD